LADSGLLSARLGPRERGTGHDHSGLRHCGRRRERLLIVRREGISPSASHSLSASAPAVLGAQRALRGERSADGEIGRHRREHLGLAIVRRILRQARPFGGRGADRPAHAGWDFRTKQEHSVFVARPTNAIPCKGADPLWGTVPSAQPPRPSVGQQVSPSACAWSAFTPGPTTGRPAAGYVLPAGRISPASTRCLSGGTISGRCRAVTGSVKLTQSATRI
jgi:hypothetical protein